MDQRKYADNEFQDINMVSQHAGVSIRAQDGGRQNVTYNDNKFNRIQQNETNMSAYNLDVNRNTLNQNKIEESRFRYGVSMPTDLIQNEENVDMERNEDEDESYQDRNQEDSSYSKGIKQQAHQKKKRGRKRKNREGGEGSTESDPDMFNYDKFIKKVSKKGTRVHMNVRMFAIRTVVPGAKVLTQANPKMSMGPKWDENGVITTNQIQKYPKNKINEIRKQSNDASRQAIVEPISQPEQKNDNCKTENLSK